MSKAVEIASTLAAVAGFVVLLAAAGATGLDRWGTVFALTGFVVMVSAAGYLIAVEKYEVEDEGTPEDAEAEAA